MMLAARRSTNRIDIYDNTPLLHQEYDANINVKRNNLFSPSPPPMSYRDLRSFMLNKSSPSNFVLIPQSFNTSHEIKNSSTPVTTSENRRKSAHRKKHKRHGVDVYRSLVRTDSRCSASPDRDIANDEMIILANSFIIDHMTATPISGFFHPQNLPNIQKHRLHTNHSARIGSSHTKSSYTSSPSLRIQHLGRKPSVPPEVMHRTSPIDFLYETDNKTMMPSPASTIKTTAATTTTTLTTMISPPMPKIPDRKQLHVYMPQMLSC
ncbi:unnamed protein product [Rotaria socialis]|uniref:Uncharacterized protein n=2 Tax=Rotaria socialis TaxID=392032 RepID=A0A817YR70_9BILA|nr:unnamed protein product [Rotaria socialis]CAF3411293.1 unnamed protein product [Rotaria socialis]CAF3577782.1 unnamed protein product [Rotaria socialis]CAF4269315.1 unnamed protein product [Rotaria socialis]CAF4374678.1 unnamed protein product [Rotaria socialis]